MDIWHRLFEVRLLYGFDVLSQWGKLSLRLPGAGQFAIVGLHNQCMIFSSKEHCAYSFQRNDFEDSRTSVQLAAIHHSRPYLLTKTYEASLEWLTSSWYSNHALIVKLKS